MPDQPERTTSSSAARNVRVVWIDADCPPAFEWTTDPVSEAQSVYPTFTQAKHMALLALRDARQRVAAAIRDTERMRREDVDG